MSSTEAAAAISQFPVEPLMAIASGARCGSACATGPCTAVISAAPTIAPSVGYASCRLIEVAAALRVLIRA